MAAAKKKQKTAASAPIEQTYSLTDGNRMKFYVQGSDDDKGTGGAYHDLATAIINAQHFIFVVDWSFQPLTRIMPRTGPANVSDTVGYLLVQAAQKSEMLVAIHTWDHTNIAAPDSMNDSGDDVLDAIAGALKKGAKRPANLLWRASSRTGFGFSHHQKFVVLDADDGDGRRVIKAFFGGLDLTQGRFDFADSPNVPPASVVEPFLPSVTAGKFSQDDWYNAEFGGDHALPREAWQDYYASVAGPAAWDILREFVGRWFRKSGSIIDWGNSRNADRLNVRTKFLSLFDKGAFMQAWEAHGGPFKARVVRSIVHEHWGPCLNTDTFPDSDLATETPTENGSKQTEFTWVVSANFERSIQINYLNAINNADRFIYIETQYFIGSGARWEGGNQRTSINNQIPGAITDKIVDRIQRGRDFHAYVVIPMFPEGPPIGGAAPAQRFFEFNTMRFMAQAVFRAANAQGKDWRDFLSFYFLARWSATDTSKNLVGKRKARVTNNRRYQVYVHSKLMIVDDQCLILGSANLNERSLAGNRDSEICVAVFPGDGKLDDTKQQIGDLRKKAWERHMDLAFVNDLDTPETPACAQSLRNIGEENWKNLAEGVQLDRGQLIHIPFTASDTAFSVTPLSRTPALQAQDGFLFDAESKAAGAPGNGTIIKPDWAWSPALGITDKPLLSAAE